MSRQDENPFADPNDINPFAAPPVANQQPATLDDFNPFAEQASQPARSPPQPKQQPVIVPQQTYAASTPATIEPTRAEKPQTYGSAQSYGTNQYGVGYGAQDNSMRQRQEELERKAAELERKEQELKKLQAAGGQIPNNFPPLPSFCCVQPCFYHDINVDIPLESQKTCKMFFYVWQLWVFTLFFNFICALAGIAKGVDSAATLFGVSILWCVLTVPCSFLCWYRPIYKALKNDSSFNYMIFFFVFFFQIIITFIFSLGISTMGSCGFINGASAMDNESEAVGAMFFICGALFLLLGIAKVLLLRKVHSAYRRSGASFEKAQSEFAQGVASNKNVQQAAAGAVVAGAQNATRFS